MRLLDGLYRWPRLLLVLSAIFWAANIIAARLAVDQISPLTLVFARWVIVLGILWPIYGRHVRMQWPQVRHQMLSIVLMALLGFTGFNALYYYAAYYATAVDLSILQVVGAFITFLGVLLVAAHGNPLAVLNLHFNREALAMIAASMCYAFYT